MPKDDEKFEQYFEKCLLLAECADTTMKRVLWLTMADTWRKLGEKSPNDPRPEPGRRVDLSV
jgi:hypothetical protein